jgi:hypothetical protein
LGKTRILQNSQIKGVFLFSIYMNKELYNKNPEKAVHMLASAIVEQNRNVAALLDKKINGPYVNKSGKDFPAGLAGFNDQMGFAVVTSEEDEVATSQALPFILKSCYGERGFPIQAFLSPEFILSQIKKGQLNTKVLYHKESQIPFGTTSNRIFNMDEWESAYRSGEHIYMEYCRTASLQKPPAGLPKANTSHITQERAWEILSGKRPAVATSHPLIFSDVRAAEKRQVNHSFVLESGATTMHSVAQMGLTPFSIGANYTFPDNGSFVQEPMVQHYMYLNKNDWKSYFSRNTLYLPEDYLLYEFIGACLKHAGIKNYKLQVLPDARPVIGKYSLNNNGVYLESKPDLEGITVSEMKTVLENSDTPRALVVKVDSLTENMSLIVELMQNGFVATGIVPGTETAIAHPRDFSIVPYKRHSQLVFTLHQTGTFDNAINMNLPDDYANSRFEVLAKLLWEKVKSASNNHAKI